MGRRPKKKVKKDEDQPPETEQIDWTAVQVPVPRRPVTRSQARILEAEKKLAKKKGKITKIPATPRRNLRVREKEKVVLEEKSYQSENATPPGSRPLESRRETRSASARRAREEEEMRARKEEYYKDKKMGKRVLAEDEGSAADSDSDTIVDKMKVEDVVGSGNLPAIIVEFTKQDIIFKQKAEEFKAGMVIAVPEITLRFNPSLSSKVAINPTMGRFVIRREGPRGPEYLNLNMTEPFQELRDLDVDELIKSICGKMKGE